MIDDKCLLGDTKTKIFKTRHLKKIFQENVKLLWENLKCGKFQFVQIMIFLKWSEATLWGQVFTWECIWKNLWKPSFENHSVSKKWNFFLKTSSGSWKQMCISCDPMRHRVDQHFRGKLIHSNKFKK